jgi:hypothetical protein
MDAIYHTSIVLNGIEYYFGQGIQTAAPGSTHHGQPMEIVKLGSTELPSEVIEEYLGSLATIYTPEVRSCLASATELWLINSSHTTFFFITAITLLKTLQCFLSVKVFRSISLICLALSWKLHSGK